MEKVEQRLKRKRIVRVKPKSELVWPIRKAVVKPMKKYEY